MENFLECHAHFSASQVGKTGNAVAVTAEFSAAAMYTRPCISVAEIDPFHKWLPVINSFVSIKISLTNLVFELIIKKNFYSRTSLVRLI